MELGKKLKDAMTIIRWATSIGIEKVILPFDAELEVQLWRIGFNCETFKYRNGNYVTQVT